MSETPPSIEYLFIYLGAHWMNDPRSLLEPLAGYLLDVLAKLRNHPFVPHSLTKLHNVAWCRQKTDARVAIEIGTFKGITTRRLSRFFDKVISVEIVPELHELSKVRCKGRNNIELILGDGAAELPRIAGRVNRAILILDGHFSGGETGHGDLLEPVLVELDRVAPHLDNIVGVIIDDFRLFGVEEGWPRKSDVFVKLEEVLPTPNWEHHVINDQFVCVRRLDQ